MENKNGQEFSTKADHGVLWHGLKVSFWVSEVHSVDKQKKIRQRDVCIEV